MLDVFINNAFEIIVYFKSGDSKLGALPSTPSGKQTIVRLALVL